MNLIKTHLKGLCLVKRKTFADHRGQFEETYNAKIFQELQLPTTWAQDNVSMSKSGVVRGLHLQLDNPQGKLITVLSGRILDVVVDTRIGSSTFGEQFSIILEGSSGTSVYIPPGMAHGFSVLSPMATFSYKCTTAYDHSSETGIVWSDPDLDLDWRVLNPIVSAKDAQLPTLKQLTTKLESGNLFI